MTWISRLLLFGLVLLIFNAVRSLLARFFRSPGPSGASRSSVVSGRTVRDPQCGMHVATDLTVTAHIGGETFHFCSEDCRSKFLTARSPDV